MPGARGMSDQYLTSHLQKGCCGRPPSAVQGWLPGDHRVGNPPHPPAAMTVLASSEHAALGDGTPGTRRHWLPRWASGRGWRLRAGCLVPGRAGLVSQTPPGAVCAAERQVSGEGDALEGFTLTTFTQNVSSHTEKLREARRPRCADSLACGRPGRGASGESWETALPCGREGGLGEPAWCLKQAEFG